MTSAPGRDGPLKPARQGHRERRYGRHLAPPHREPAHGPAPAPSRKQPRAAAGRYWRAGRAPPRGDGRAGRVVSARAPWRGPAGGGRGRGSRGGERRAPSPRSVLARGGGGNRLAPPAAAAAAGARAGRGKGGEGGPGRAGGAASALGGPARRPELRRSPHCGRGVGRNPSWNNPGAVGPAAAPVGGVWASRDGLARPSRHLRSCRGWEGLAPFRARRAPFSGRARAPSVDVRGDSQPRASPHPRMPLWRPKRGGCRAAAPPPPVFRCCRSGVTQQRWRPRAGGAGPPRYGGASFRARQGCP